ncbi:MAG: DUF1934 domain-containing protein [Lachnospiraceae bacterium]|nr:DUF1934 domain-containing protein [Lachnospiraceae bacterium]
MNKNSEVQVEITNFQHTDTMDPLDMDILRTKALGRLTQKKEALFLVYKERDAESGEITRNIITFRKGQMRLHKSGQICWEAEFEVGRSYAAVYQTPYGNYPMRVHTLELEVVEEDHQMLVRLHYLLDQGQQEEVDCKMEILLKEGLL